MSSLLQWAQNTLRTVETDGATPTKVKLITQHDGNIWHTWFAPFGSPEDWTAQAEGYMRSLEQEWPARVIAITYVAESAQGETISQLPFRVTGKTRAGALDGQTAAAQHAFDEIAVTIEKLQRLTNTQLDAARRTCEVNNETMHQMSQLIRLYRERDMMGHGEEKSGLQSLLEQHSGELIQIVSGLIPK